MQRNHLQHESYSSEAYVKGAEFLYINRTFMEFSFVGFFWTTYALPLYVERLSSITFENVETKPVFFLKTQLSFEKKLSTSEMKKLLHPSEISVKC